MKATTRLAHRRPGGGRRLSSPSSSSASSVDDFDAPAISPVNTSLALSVHFRHPSLGMKDYEILSRATAFLLRVDPPEPNDEDGGRTTKVDDDDDDDGARGGGGKKKTSLFPHLRESIDLRNKLLRRQDYKYDPASGPRRPPHRLSWLEFCPPAFRPNVHVVASSHVISPWLWPKYYGQDWLREVGPEHVRYSLEVWGGGGDDAAAGRGIAAAPHDGKLAGDYRPLAKFALNPHPIHHPTGMDLAVIHLKDEDETLRLMTKMGIMPLHLPAMHELESSEDPVFEPGERVLFQGFEVFEANRTDRESLVDDALEDAGDDDRRLFHPYSSLGVLAMASPDRFLARTPAGPLPEGLCGGPAIQLPSATSSNNKKSTRGDIPLIVRGVVEGIVPTNHESRELAGLASLLPSYRVREFVDYAERIMLEQIIDKDLFGKVVDLKEKKDRRGTTYGTGREGEVHEVIDGSDDVDDDELPDDPILRATMEGTSEEPDTPRIDREYQEIIVSLRENHTPEEVDAILATVEREREEVIKIMETEGGDMDDVIEFVRRKTYEEKNRILDEIETELKGQMSPKEGKPS